jgi:type IV pilus assembly protein PilC
MAQFRLKAVSKAGKAIQTEFEAENKKEAQIKVDRLSKTNGLKVQSIDQKAVFLYKVKRAGKKPVNGEQEAYNKEELERALVKLGYQVVSINKKWFDFKGGVPMDEVVSFIRMCADLLRQQITFDEILNLII